MRLLKRPIYIRSQGAYGDVNVGSLQGHLEPTASIEYFFESPLLAATYFVNRKNMLHTNIAQKGGILLPFCENQCGANYGQLSQRLAWAEFRP